MRKNHLELTNRKNCRNNYNSFLFKFADFFNAYDCFLHLEFFFHSFKIWEFWNVGIKKVAWFFKFTISLQFYLQIYKFYLQVLNIV